MVKPCCHCNRLVPELNKAGCRHVGCLSQSPQHHPSYQSRSGVEGSLKSGPTMSAMRSVELVIGLPRYETEGSGVRSRSVHLGSGAEEALPSLEA
jgi:hypothetical protein